MFFFKEVIKVYKEKIESLNDKFHQKLADEKNEKLLEKMERQVF